MLALFVAVQLPEEIWLGLAISVPPGIVACCAIGLLERVLKSRTGRARIRSLRQRFKRRLA